MALLLFLQLAIRVETAFFRPDLPGGVAWTEGAAEIKAFFRKDYRPAGAVHIYLANEAARGARLVRGWLDGEPLPVLERPGPMRGAHKVVWWRLLPDSIPPEGIAEAIVRLRDAPKGPVRLVFEFEGDKKVEATVKPEPLPFRIGTVGFRPDRREVVLCLEKLTEKPLTVKRIFLDGRDVTRRAKVLVPSFFQGICPVVLKTEEPLEVGSYHTFVVSAFDEKGREVKTACTLRASDEFVPLGTYGFKTFEEFARNGLNTYVCFGSLTRRDLDALQTLGMRGVSALGRDGAPVGEVCGHPALLAHYLMDEPDVRDYYVEGLPHPQRMGQWAMEMERRARLCRERDPRTLTYLVVDLTYKPDNWFVYGEIPDILATDPYALAAGEGPEWVAEVVRTAWEACRPRQLVAIVQAWWFEPKDEERLRKQKFPRPPFPGEERQMMLYALGSGARGLVTYIHCTERPKGGISHGAGEYPDLWAEVGKVYREVEAVAPLISVAHPTALAKSSRRELWLRVLVCADEALLVVGVNRACESKREDFIVKPLDGVEVEVPKVPWLEVRRAYLVAGGKFRPLTLRAEGRRIVAKVGKVREGFLLLLAKDDGLRRRLEDRLRGLERRRAEGLLRLWRRRQAEEARYALLRRIVPVRFRRFILVGRVVGGYGIERKTFWNPTGERWNGLEWYTDNPADGEVRGATWEAVISTEQVGRPLVFLVCAHPFGGATFRALDEAGKVVAEQQFSGEESVYSFAFTPPRAGKYRLEVVERERGPKGGRVSKAAFLVPLELARELVEEGLLGGEGE